MELRRGTIAAVFLYCFVRVAASCDGSHMTNFETGAGFVPQVPQLSFVPTVHLFDTALYRDCE